MSQDSTPQLFLIDGYGFVFRAYHVLPPLTNPAGTPVGAVVGFCNMLHKLLERIRSHADKHDTYLAVILDAGAKNFRHELDPQYKANRPPAPEDLKPQFPLIREATEAFNLPAIDAVGYEADDLIATYARQAEKAGMRVTIISSDKDLMQLVNDRIEMYDPVKDKRIGRQEVIEKFGVPPEQVRDVLALMGDSSDNVPGVPGIGPKTAAELITQYNTLENLYNNISAVKQVKRKETLENAKANAFLSRELVSLYEDAPAPPLETLAFQKRDDAKLKTFFESHGFSGLTKRIFGAVSTPAPLPAATPQKAPETPSEVATVNTEADLLAAVKKATPGIIAALFSTDALEIAVSPTLSYRLPLGAGQAGDLFSQPKNPLESAIRLLSQLAMPVIAYNAKPWLHLSPELQLIDLELMEYALKGSVRDAPSAPSATALYQHYLALCGQLAQSHLARVFWRLDKPAQNAIAAMEKRGIALNTSFLLSLSQRFAGEIGQLEREIFAMAGQEFNIGSPKQLGEVLFEQLQIPGGKKSAKSGAYGTDSDVLETLVADGFPIAALILKWRGLSKLKNTYTDALPKSVNPATGRVHTTFNLASTSTGRLSSEAPNLQNIPIRTPEGKEIRKAFVAKPGCVLISADYSQIELRLLAHIADLPQLKEAFRNGIDIHTQTAAQVFGLAPEAVTPEQRRSAKAINFGIIYGQSAFGLAASLGISREQAGRYIKAYFEQFPGIQDYMERTKQFAREHGYVETLLGRKCYTPLIHDKIPARRQFAERAAINAPLQGSAADIIKKAMITLHHKGVPLLLQVHDELVAECPAAQAEKTAGLLKNVMENTLQLSIPLTVDVSIGECWE